MSVIAQNNNTVVSLRTVIGSIHFRLNFLYDMLDLLTVENGQVTYQQTIFKEEQDPPTISVVDFILLETEIEVLKTQLDIITNWLENSDLSSHIQSASLCAKRGKQVSLVTVYRGYLDRFGCFNNLFDYKNPIANLNFEPVRTITNNRKASAYEVQLVNTEKHFIAHQQVGYFSIV